ncbi:MAG: hypothetical protein ACYDBH_00495 [Acidobacteriaceae bacterium]
MATVDVGTMVSNQAAAVAMIVGQAESYLQSLVDISNTLLTDTGTVDLPSQYNYASVPNTFFEIEGAARPTISIPTSQVPTAPTFNISAPLYVTLPTDDLLIPTTQFQYFEAPYQSILLDPLQTKLLNDLLNGGYGIEPADEEALFQRATDREVQAMLLRIDGIGVEMARRGFPLPPGELAISVDRAYQEMQSKVSSVSREITLERSKLYVDNRRFTIQEVREIERITIGFHNSVQERALNVAKLTVEMSIAIYNMLVARFRARLDAARITSEVQYQFSQVQVEQARAAIEAYRGQIAAFEANLRGMLEPAKLSVEVYRGDIDAARLVNDASIAITTLETKALEATVQQNIEISKMTIENARVQLLATIEQLKFRTEAAKFGGDKFFALLTSMEGTVNTLAVQTAAT